MLGLALLVLANLAGSFFCSLSEAALLAASEARIRARLPAWGRRAERLLELRRDPGRTLASIVFLNNVFAIAGTAFITHQATGLIASPLGMAAFIALQTFLIITLGEIVPKVLGEALPEPIAARVAPALQVVRALLHPMVWVVQRTVSWARPRGRVLAGEETEIRELAIMGREGGHLDPEEAELIHRVFRLDDITAEDVMTPRALVNAFEAATTLSEAREALITASHSRFPVFDGDLDKVVGVLWLRDALSALARGQGDRSVRDVMRSPLFLPSSRAVDDVLRDLQQSHRKIAVVLDEYGITQGVITMDDLVEELLGEAVDEADVSEGLVKRVSRQDALVHGLTRVGDVAHFLHCDVRYEDPEEETSTVTGLLQERLGRIPQAGDRLTLPGGLSFEVREADARMAVRVLVRNASRTAATAR